jgi:hypothetical protein
MKESLTANMMLTHYRIISPLGAGGMGEVWAAEDTKLERKVALNLLPAQLTQDADRVRRFIQEAKAASALNHPNIITIHEIAEADAGRFIVMELGHVSFVCAWTNAFISSGRSSVWGWFMACGPSISGLSKTANNACAWRRACKTRRCLCSLTGRWGSSILIWAISMQPAFTSSRRSQPTTLGALTLQFPCTALCCAARTSLGCCSIWALPINQAKSLELRAVMSLARLCRRQGKIAEAHRRLDEVFNWFTEGFETPDLRDAKSLLQELR